MNSFLTLASYDVGVKRSFAPNWCQRKISFRIAPQQAAPAILKTFGIRWFATQITPSSCLAGPKFKSLIMQAWTAFWPFDPGIIILLNRYRTYVRFFACVYSSIKFADCQSFFLSVECFWQICRKGFCFLYRKSSRMASAALIINVSYVSSQYFSTTSPCFL